MEDAQLSENAKIDHFSTFSTWTPCIYYVYGINTLKKEKKVEEKNVQFFVDPTGFVPTISGWQAA